IISSPTSPLSAGADARDSGPVGPVGLGGPGRTLSILPSTPGSVPPTPALDDDDYALPPDSSSGLGPGANKQSLSANATPQITPNGGKGKSDQSEKQEPTAIDLPLVRRNTAPLP